MLSTAGVNSISAPRAQLIEANRKSETHGTLRCGTQGRQKSSKRKPTSNWPCSNAEQQLAARISTPIAISRPKAFFRGYNFPRLPLYAFVPAIGGGGPKAAYLQRARFIAIAEFGPGSLIYHEGRAYRVYKAKLPAGIRTEDGGRLSRATIYVCDECGAGHEQDEPNAVMLAMRRWRSSSDPQCACASTMSRQGPQSGSPPMMKIASGMALKFRRSSLGRGARADRRRIGSCKRCRWPDPSPGLRLGRKDQSTEQGATATQEKRAFSASASILQRADGLAARSMKGTRREPDEPVKQRIVPIVQDHKNAALIRVLGEPLGTTSMATLQHALARGLELVFQLEEGEILDRTGPAT